MRKNKWLVILLGMICFLVGCEQKPISKIEPNTEQEETIRLTVFDKNSADNTFTDPIAEEIMRKTGVRIEVVNPTSEPEERLELMLSHKDYPDIVLIGQGELVNRYIEAGAFIPLDDLIENNGEHIKEMYGDILEKCRYTDGKLYWLANWYGPDTDASAGVLMRRDLLAQIAGEERAYSNEPFTLSEYTQILHEVKERFPELEGKKTIPLELDEDKQNYMGTLHGMFGFKTYDITEQGELQFLEESPRYEEALLYLNKVYREGLLDKEWVINKSSQWEERLSEGSVFSSWNSYWDVESVNENLAKQIGEEAQFFCYKVVADDLSPEDTTYNGRMGLGWDAIGITDNCKNPEAAIRVADFLASEEGQYLMLWGVEGESWDYKEGIHVPKETFLANWYQEPGNMKKKSGIRKWTWFIHNGIGSDGTPYDLTTKYVPDEHTAFANASIAETDYWDISVLNGLEPPGNTELGLKWQKIEEICSDYRSRIICASSEKEAQLQFHKMTDELGNIGIAECMEYINAQYQKRVQMWGEEIKY